MMNAYDLLDLLEARSGIVCAVGAGGKKTTLWRLAALHPGRAALTATVLTPPVPQALGIPTVIADETGLAAAVTAAAAGHRKVAYFLPSAKEGRLGGVPSAAIAALHGRGHFDVTLVKGDGARMRWIKCPNDDEPQVPEGTATLIPIVSARALGEPLTERIAHRIERIEAVTGARRGERFEPLHLARLLASERGLLKGARSARIVPVINMVDDAQRERLAWEAAEAALALTTRFDRILLCSMRASEPIVRAVERAPPSRAHSGRHGHALLAFCNDILREGEQHERLRTS